MRIAAQHSHLNGFEYIQYHHKAAWDEVVDVIARIDASQHKTKVSKEKRNAGTRLYSPASLNKAFKAAFRVHDWLEKRTSYWVTEDANLILKTMEMKPAALQKDTIEAGGFTAFRTHNQTDFVKNGIAVEIQMGKYAFVAYDLFVKHMAFYIGRVIDVGIEVVPMKAMTMEMSSGIAYYENELYNLLRQGRSTPAVPLVILGIVP